MSAWKRFGGNAARGGPAPVREKPVNIVDDFPRDHVAGSQVSFNAANYGAAMGTQDPRHFSNIR